LNVNIIYDIKFVGKEVQWRTSTGISGSCPNGG